MPRGHPPRSLVDLGWLRVGADSGIVSGLGAAAPDLTDWHGIDVDLALDATAEATLGAFTVRGAYDHASHGIRYARQHRARPFADYPWLTLGADYPITDIGRGAASTPIGATAGISVDCDPLDLGARCGTLAR